MVYSGNFIDVETGVLLVSVGEIVDTKSSADCVDSSDVVQTDEDNVEEVLQSEELAADSTEVVLGVVV